MTGYTGVFSNFDGIVNDALERDDAETCLMAAYLDFFNELKERVGTSSGFTGLPEYLFFQAVKKGMEKKLGKPFDPHVESGGTKSFRAKFPFGELILTRDLAVNQILGDGSKIRPDIALYKAVDNKPELIAIFQIKIYVSSPKTAEEEVRAINSLQGSNFSTYLVFLTPPGGKALDTYLTFLETGRGRVIMGEASRFPEPHNRKNIDKRLLNYKKEFKLALDDIRNACRL